LSEREEREERNPRKEKKRRMRLKIEETLNRQNTKPRAKTPRLRGLVDGHVIL
jgi:hypothetical protein